MRSLLLALLLLLPGLASAQVTYGGTTCGPSQHYVRTYHFTKPVGIGQNLRFECTYTGKGPNDWCYVTMGTYQYTYLGYGCHSYSTNTLQLGAQNFSSGLALSPWTIPNDTNLIGVTLYTQHVVIEKDPLAFPLGYTTSYWGAFTITA